MTYQRLMHYRFVVLGAAVMTVVSMWPLTAFAALVETCDGHNLVWESDPDQLRASEDSFPSGNPFHDALGDVVDRFNRNPSNFRHSLRYDEKYVGTGGARSEIWFTSDPELHRGFNAMTWTRYTCDGGIKAKDITLNANTVWTSGIAKANFEGYGGGAVSFRATLMHELGHTMGLLHEGDEYNVMGTGGEHIHANCRTARVYLGEDASNGAVFLYGANASAGEDVGIVHWKWNEEMEFSYGNYSDHVRTQLYPISPPFIDPWLENGEPVYMLRNGQIVGVEFTYENNGASTQRDVRVRFYLSTDDCINRMDSLIGEAGVNLGRNDVFTTTTYIVLPDSLVFEQDYYIGAIIDATRALEEFDEANNSTYVARFRVKPEP